ncbi:MAG: mechanosensitive ion channel family protein [Phycisphaerae bacterium]|nr:mechanosensitive ion channel family protein [Phycisphaerae bacterium]NNF41615.1 mechanosensitive ion channel family protein [Phycisphaerales bacterium]
MTIDPGQSDAIDVQTPEAPAGDASEESAGPVTSAIEDVLPDTGLEAVDTSVDTLAESVGGMIDAFVVRLPQFVIAIIVIVLTGLVASLATKWLRRITRKLRFKDNLQDLLGKFAYIGVWFVGLVAAAGVVFPGLGMGELVATAGLASIAIGFAFQDIFENFLAGILIIWRFPFNDGDFIEIPSEGVEGEVEEVQIRMTLIRSVTGELILVPNSTIYKNVVRVLTNKPVRRMTVMCGVAYGEDIGESRKVIREAVESCGSVEQDRPIEIFAQAFGASSIDFEVTWWTGARPVEQRQSRDEVVERVKKALDDAGIEIPYPYRTLTFSKNEPDIIEAIAARGRRDD